MNSAFRTVSTAVAFATLTAALTLTVFWPKATFADGDDALQNLALNGTAVADKLVVTGTLVRDAHAKTGWVVEVKAENRGTAPESCNLETDVQKTVASPMSRAMPMPTTVWQNKETITLAAGEKVTRRYVVPANVAAQLTANANAPRVNARNGKAPQMPQAVTYFGVVFQKAHA